MSNQNAKKWIIVAPDTYIRSESGCGLTVVKECGKYRWGVVPIAFSGPNPTAESTSLESAKRRALHHARRLAKEKKA